MPRAGARGSLLAVLYWGSPYKSRGDFANSMNNFTISKNGHFAPLPLAWMACAIADLKEFTA